MPSALPPFRLSPCLLVGLLTLGCQNAGEDRVLAVEATGSVFGSAFFDGDGNGRADGSDLPMEDLRVYLVVAGGLDTAGVGTSNSQGTYSIEDLPVGRYDVLIDTSTVGDTAIIVLNDSATVTVRPADSVSILMGVSFPSVSLTELKQLPVGERVFTEAVALTALNAFGDTTLHVGDAATSLRATRVQFQTVAAGDSVRLLGRRGSRDGQPTLDFVQAFLLGVGTVRPAERITTALAATADSARLDAALVRVVTATISDTTTRQFDFVVTADDGSGALEIVFDIDAGLTIPIITLPDSVTQATVMDVTGVLVPDGSGAWLLKPRVNADVTLQ